MGSSNQGDYLESGMKSPISIKHNQNSKPKFQTINDDDLVNVTKSNG